jgi:hypothetical protein
MENILLWASVVSGVLVFVSAFLTRREPSIADGAPPPGENVPMPPALRGLVIALPLLGMIVTLPTSGAFSAGQGLGRGFFLGGVAALLAFLPLLRGGRLGGRDLLAGHFGIAAAAVALPFLFLRASLLDALMGIAIGWFSVAFTLYLGQSAKGREQSGAALATATGFLLTLCAGALIGTLRTPTGMMLSSKTWGAALIAFGAFGSVLLYAASFLPATVAAGLTWMRLAVMVGGGALTLYQLSAKVVSEPKMALLGIGGLFLGPVALLLLRDAARRARLAPSPLPNTGLPILAVLLVTSGFLVAFQMLQAFGASVAVLALWLVLPAAMAYAPATDSDSDANADNRALYAGMVTLLLFTTGLLLYRLFAARWTGSLRGVNLTDQYALFGLLIGGALPSLLAAVPLRLRPNNGASSVLTLAVCGALTLLAPGAVLLLFGPKCALALLIGLALGSAQVFVGTQGTVATVGFFPALLALAVALALCQWSGLLLPAVADLTRAAKVRWLVGLMAGLTALLFAADRVNVTAIRKEEAAK